MNYKILIVDDNPEIREVVNVLLSNEGYMIEEACDGFEAIKKANDKDLIILDIMMPNMNGYDFINDAQYGWLRGMSKDKRNKQCANSISDCQKYGTR